MYLIPHVEPSVDETIFPYGVARHEEVSTEILHLITFGYIGGFFQHNEQTGDYHHCVHDILSERITPSYSHALRIVPGVAHLPMRHVFYHIVVTQRHRMRPVVRIEKRIGISHVLTFLCCDRIRKSPMEMVQGSPDMVISLTPVDDLSLGYGARQPFEGDEWLFI
jgi:hypothetical protein